MICNLSIYTAQGLVTNYGERGLQNGRGGGAPEVLPLRKGGGKSFSNAEGGHNKFWGSFYMVA